MKFDSISQVQEALKLRMPKTIIVLTPAEHRQRWPEMAEDFEDGEYLIVLDADEFGPLDGAYGVELQDGEFHASWWPYPEEPFNDIDKFIEHLNSL